MEVLHDRRTLLLTGFAELLTENSMKDPNEIRGTMRGIAVYHVPMIVYAAAIIAVSSIPNIKTPETDFPALDKLAHFVEYAVFAFLTFRSFSNLSARISVNLVLILSVLFLSLFAFLDEYHQSFVPGRQQDYNDFLADCLGAFLVIVFLWLRRRRLSEPAS